MNRQRLIYLVKKRRQGICSDAENEELYKLMLNPAIEKELLLLWDQLHDDKSINITEDESHRLYGRILSGPEVRGILRPSSRKFVRSKLQKIVGAAAVLAILWAVGLTIFRYNAGQGEVFSEISERPAQVLPGTSKAKVVFEDGTYVELGAGSDGHVENSFFSLGGHDEGISYHESAPVGRQKAPIHTLMTPVGGEYAVRLADGTKVWLNASSTLKYPASFNGAGTREVELEGEAYFDVAKVTADGRQVPFVVKSNGQVLEVLGTEFNINTFSDKITTTLVEGSVKLSFDNALTNESYILRPNDQSVYDGRKQKARIAQIDTYYVTAWKSGDFAFDNAPLKDVMADIARWYNVSVEYKSEVSDIRFSGKVSKFEDIETLLQTIEWTGSVKLKLDGRRVIVMK